MTIRDAIQIVVARRASFRQVRTSALGPDSSFRVFSNLLSLDEPQMRYASGFSEVDLQVLFFVTGIAPGLGASHDRPSDRREIEAEGGE